MYTWDSRVRFSEVGEDKRLTLDGVLNYFQDCSTFQSEDLGIGMEAVEALHRVWVLNAWQIVVNEYPKLGEKIVTGTWPYEFNRFNIILYGHTSLTDSLAAVILLCTEKMAESLPMQTVFGLI